MKYKAVAWILILCLACLAGCDFLPPRPVDASDAAAATATADAAQATPDAAQATPDATLPTADTAPDDAQTADIPDDFFTKDALYAAHALSEAVASAVWQYGEDFGWVDETGLSDAAITPLQLASSQAAYRQALIQWFWEDPLLSLGSESLSDEDKEDLYARVLFPGVEADALPESDKLKDFSMGISPISTVEAARALFSAASPDGYAGYVIVRMLYEYNDAEYEDFYRVEWEATADGSIFPYRLTGVRPMMRYQLGGIPYDNFNERYAASAPAAVLEALGIHHALGNVAKWGGWGEGTSLVVKTTLVQGDDESNTYLFIDDDEENLVYLSAFDEPEGDDNRYVPKKWLTPLQAKDMLLTFYIEAEPFYPGELDKWVGDVRCYGFGYDDGDAYRYVWVNAETYDVEFADEIENYTGEGDWVDSFNDL